MTGGDFTLQKPRGRELNGGDLLAQSLLKLGVEVAFGLHGGHLDAFLMGCNTWGIKLVDTRHETVAVQAAEGYSKIAAKTGVCFVTANSGFSNGIPGLATALGDRSSILVITSSVPLREQETNCLQGAVDQVVAAAPLTKFTHRVTHAEDIPRIVSHAMRVASAGAPGPVLIDFPIDVLFSPIHESSISWGALGSPLPLVPGPHLDAVEQTLRMIHAAKRPAIITGTGVWISEGAASELEGFAEKLQIPVFSSLKYTAPLRHDHPLNAGSAKNLAVLDLLKKEVPDLVILLAARTGLFLGDRSGAIIPHSAKIIQVDTDYSEIGRVLPVDLGVTSDVGQFLRAVNQTGASRELSKNWLDDIASIKSLKDPEEAANEIPHDGNGNMHPYHGFKALCKAIGEVAPDSIIITDGGEAALWAGQVLSYAQPHTVISATGYLGFLGNGFGYSLGAAIASQGKRMVVNIQGDGSSGFHLMELDTYHRFDLNILTVVANNHAWGMSINGQDLFYGNTETARPISKLGTSAHYDAVARALGNDAVRLQVLGEVEPKVSQLIKDAKGAKMVELLISEKPTHPTTKALLGMPEDDNDSVVVVPYYSNIPRLFPAQK